MDLQRLETNLKLREGFKSLPYLDTKGNWTIAYGRNLSAVPLTPEEGWYLSKGVLDYAIEHAPLLVHNWASLGDARQNVLVELVYNIGLTSALKFQRMRAALDAADYGAAAGELLDSTWRVDVGAARATEMSHQLLTGEWV